VYVERLIPAYYKGFAEFASVTEVEIIKSKAAIRDFILVLFGYSKAQRHMFTECAKKKAQAEKELQMVYDFKI